ncbi:hypothetical protein D1AOALGA4SA_12298 [Olavius algarvensis Delta 1 endosymbiont]|nr:hypothetical protein D1AOALGA4SA_12298 [Olavius algarvensis Delta 1 endosymbiont]
MIDVAAMPCSSCRLDIIFQISFISTLALFKWSRTGQNLI